ncbi:DUF5615 family PIN-like protein [Deinococcus aquaedulcis]|uniref:DUF5615 family PIN-like protein n=1 Tax=Deinococcus aquaedulcis TaxID=2840455 RepID=UPI002E29D490|nr:DUF5615 family PIN-like protein [Deinococcus aquaedulcis]
MHDRAGLLAGRPVAAVSRPLAQFGAAAYSVGYPGYRDAEDEVIFQAARMAGAVVVSKDADFLERVRRLGTPPQLLYVTCGNTSKARLMTVFERHFAQAHALLEAGEPVVELADASS